MKRVILWVVTILSLLACGYSFLGVIMVAMLSGAPNYSQERAQFNGNLWGYSTITFFLLSVVLSILIWKSRKNKRSSNSW